MPHKAAREHTAYPHQPIGWVIRPVGRYRRSRAAPRFDQCCSSRSSGRSLRWLREFRCDTVSGDVTLNLLVYAVATPAQRDTLPDRVRQFQPGFTDDRIAAAPSILFGTTHEIADTIREYRERYGITYFTMLEPDMAAFAPVIELLK
ncbi:hypothetical protein [Nocardia brasiliensis]|uniref:hypothetical protein n=1 Tax=Nocardia brasiliensis TaxID=37326 RepID=UPI00157FD644|nr:hypothetical protein [Nocardia brasiliensis]